jgi:hypothetical protein
VEVREGVCVAVTEGEWDTLLDRLLLAEGVEVREALRDTVVLLDRLMVEVALLVWEGEELGLGWADWEEALEGVTDSLQHPVALLLMEGEGVLDSDIAAEAVEEALDLRVAEVEGLRVTVEVREPLKERGEEGVGREEPDDRVLLVAAGEMAWAVVANPAGSAQ